MSSLPTQNVITQTNTRIAQAPAFQTAALGAQQQFVGQQQVVNVSETEQVIDVQERRVVHNTNITSAQPKTIVDTQKHLATEIPITTEKHILHEYVPVTMEKIIQRIPVVVGQKVTTGIPLTGETDIQALGVQYVQQQVQTEVDLQPRMQTRVGVTEIVNQQVVGGNQIITEQRPVTQEFVRNAQFQTLQNQGAQFQNQQFFNQQQILQNQQLANQQFQNQLHNQQILNQQSQQFLANKPLINQQLLNQQNQAQFANQQFANQQFANQQFHTNQYSTSANLLNTQQAPIFTQSSSLLNNQPTIATTNIQSQPNTFVTKIEEKTETFKQF